jgi:hypothetical protein
MLRIPAELAYNIFDRLTSTTLARLSLANNDHQSLLHPYLEDYRQNLTLPQALRRRDLAAIGDLVERGALESLDVIASLLEAGENDVLRGWLTWRGIEPWRIIRPILKHISRTSSFPNYSLEQSYGILIDYYRSQGQPVSDWQQLYFLHQATLADAVIDHLSFDDARLDYTKFPHSPSTITTEQYARYLQCCKGN